MREKRDNLWRFIRTSLLLVSAAAALFGCASKNPLIDEDTPVDDDRTVIAAIEADEQKLREEQALKERQEKERILAEFPGSPVVIMPNSGLCCYYAEDGGMIIGFEKAL